MLISRIRKNTKAIIWGFVITFGVSIFFMYGFNLGGRQRDPSAAGRKSKIPQVVLKVDKSETANQTYYYKYLQVKRDYEAMSGQSFNTYPMITWLKSQVVDLFINQEILLQEAKKRNIRVDSAEIAKRIRLEQDRYIGQGDGLDNPSVQARFKKFFSDQEREKEFRDIIARQGITYDFFKKQIKRDLIQEKVLKAIGEELEGAEKEVAKKKADGLMEKLATGEPFENLAREFSDDETTKESGGYIGWTERGTLQPEYEKAAFAMNRGDISRPIETEAGYHVIYLRDKIEATGPEYEAKKPELIMAIRERRGDETYQPSEDEIKGAYEKINTSQILIRVKANKELAADWMQRERDKGIHKIEIVNPEINAYRYLNRQMIDPGAGEIDLDKAIKLYEKAIDVDKGNQYLYYQMGQIYERKNSRLQFEAMEKKTGDESDPYEAALAEVGEEETAPVEFDLDEGADKAAPEAEADKKSAPEKAVDKEAAPEKEEVASDPNKYLAEALEMYLKAVEISESVDVYKFDSMLYLAAAGVADKLEKTDVAIRNYVEAVYFSAGNINYLTRIQEGLLAYEEESEKAAKALVEVRELIEELQAEDDPYNVDGQLDDEAADKGEEEGASDADAESSEAAGETPPEETPES